jgi:hypothetical protein
MEAQAGPAERAAAADAEALEVLERPMETAGETGQMDVVGGTGPRAGAEVLRLLMIRKRNRSWLRSTSPTRVDLRRYSKKKQCLRCGEPRERFDLDQG